MLVQRGRRAWQTDRAGHGHGTWLCVGAAPRACLPGLAAIASLGDGDRALENDSNMAWADLGSHADCTGTYFQFVLDQPRRFLGAVDAASLEMPAESTIVVIMEMRQEKVLDARSLSCLGELIHHKLASGNTVSSG